MDLALRRGAAGDDGHGAGVQPSRLGGPDQRPTVADRAHRRGGVTLAAILGARIRPAAVGLAVLVVAWLAAAVAPGSEPIDVDGTRDDNALITVAAVQGGGPQNTRADVCEQRAVFERHLNTTRQQVSTPVDLVVWPEDVVHPSPDTAITPARCDQPAACRQRSPGRALGVGPRPGHGAHRRLLRADRRPRGQPQLCGRLRLVGGAGRHLRQGPARAVRGVRPAALNCRTLQRRAARPGRPGRASDEPAVLDTPLGPLGVAISWEIFFDHRARSAVGGGDGRVLLNPTNGSSYWLTVVQTQQIASSRLRAIETDRWVVQAAPTGFSAVITPEGDVIERTGISESRVIQTTVELRHGDTLAVRLGAWPVAAAAVLTLSLALGLGRVLTRSRRGRKF